MNPTTTPPWLLAIEIGGTKLQLALGRGGGKIVDMERLDVRPDRGAEGIREQIVDAFATLLHRHGLQPNQIDAAGIGFGGPVDVKRGVVTTSHQISGWDGYPLVSWVQETLKIRRVVLQNDADTAALGEARFGAGVGLSPVLYVNSGSGIGGGLVIDGRIYPGSGHGAVEIGHLWMVDEREDGDEPLILEDLASGWAIGENGRRLANLECEQGKESGGLLTLAAGDPSKVTAMMVAESARRFPDGPSKAILFRATRAMGRALAHAITLLAPRRVVLGGGVSLMDDDLWLDPIRAVVNERVFPPFRGTFDIVTASLGESVVLHGALALAADAI